MSLIGDLCVCVCRDRRAVERYSVTSRRKSYILDAGRSVPFSDHHPYLSSRVTAAILPIVASLIIDRSDTRLPVFRYVCPIFYFYFRSSRATYMHRGTWNHRVSAKDTFTHTQRKKKSKTNKNRCIHVKETGKKKFLSESCISSTMIVVDTDRWYARWAMKQPTRPTRRLWSVEKQKQEEERFEKRSNENRCFLSLEFLRRVLYVTYDPSRDKRWFIIGEETR